MLILDRVSVKHFPEFPTVTQTGKVRNPKPKEDEGSGGLNWSGRGDLNPRQLAWEARTLPLSYARSRDQDSHSRCELSRSQGTKILRVAVWALPSKPVTPEYIRTNLFPEFNDRKFSLANFHRIGSARLEGYHPVWVRKLLSVHLDPTLGNEPSGFRFTGH